MTKLLEYTTRKVESLIEKCVNIWTPLQEHLSAYNADSDLTSKVSPKDHERPTNSIPQVAFHEVLEFWSHLILGLQTVP
jgi:hypothetical protein